MKKLLGFILTVLCLSSYSQETLATSNAIKMAYNFTTVSQTVVFDNTMRAGGTLELSAKLADGGGRNPGDPITMKLVFYNSSNAVIATTQQAYTMVLGAAATTYSITSNNCGSSCANVAYVSVQFYGKDGGYWAGNYGPYIQDPSLKFNGGANILYNPEFGTYSGNSYAQGWSSTAGWQNCALYSGSATCIIDNGAPVNGGNYSATGGSTSGTAGGYTAPAPAPSLCCGGSSAPFTADSTKSALLTTYGNRTTNDSKVYIEQIGNSNNITVNQSGTKQNYVNYFNNGSFNDVTINQSGNGLTQANYVDLKMGTNGSPSNSNTINITQQSTAGAKAAFVNITDSNNTVSIQQKDNGNHWADVTLSGGNKNLSILQQGSGSHMANINLSGTPTTLNLTQSGSTQQFYSIQHNCATGGGCGTISVTQGQ